MRIKKGFTLAETLVTLAVVAMIATIALPTLFKSKPNQEMLMLKKAYYLTARGVNELINDEDFYPDDDTETRSGFSHVHTTPEATYHGHTYSGDSKFCGLFAARMNVKGDIDCDTEHTFTAGSAPDNGNFTTADGVVWIMPLGDFDRDGAMDYKASILVDVNGVKAGNCFATDANCSNPDRFEIKLDRWGKIYVEDELTRKYLSLTNATKTYHEVDSMGKAVQEQPAQ